MLDDNHFVNIIKEKISKQAIQLVISENENTLFQRLQDCLNINNFNKIRVYVKANQALTNSARQMLFENKIKPWEIFVYNLID